MKFRDLSDNLNLALANGLWAYNPSTVNHPSDNEYGVCLVLNAGNASYTGNAWFFQLAFGTDGHIRTRCSINATDASGWTNWVRVS